MNHSHSKRRRITKRRQRPRHVVVPVFSKNHHDNLPNENEVENSEPKKNINTNSPGNIIDGMREFFTKKKGFVM
jgi:hypothetical protein